MIDLLQQGIAAARSGKRGEARTLLMQVVKADQHNEQAWLWLSGVVDDPQDMRTCLQNVLDLNPDNQRARQGLAWVEQRYGPPAPPLERAVGAPLLEPAPSARPSSSAGASYIEPATKPSLEVAQSTVIATAPDRTKPAEPIVGARPEHPCPYCGAPTVLTQKACTQCRGDLMIRAAPAENRSLALTVLGLLWGIGGVLLLLLTVLAFFLFLLARQAVQTSPAASSADTFLVVVAITLITGLLYLGLARGLLGRRRWAYYANLLLIGLILFGLLGSVAAGPALIGALAASLSSARSAGATAGTIGRVVLIVVAIAFVLLPIALTIMSYPDFFGPTVRFQPAIEPGDHREHYNSGIAYKNRGMWYMAAQEWEAAIDKQPREPNYLHALGLAYAQLKRYDRARATLDTAIQAAPDNQQIKESRALVDRMAMKT
jgi:tetratricopeptide (TPR) repeat protein